MATWGHYDGALPGPLVRATAGDFLRLTLDKPALADTTIHWHGIRLPNAADGVPALTQDPVKTGGKFVYEFTAPDPGTRYFHPTSGPARPRAVRPDDHRRPQRPRPLHDAEWVVVLDDWIDGTGTTPTRCSSVDRRVAPQRRRHGGMGGMDHGSMGGMSMETGPWGDAGTSATRCS